MYDAFPEFPVVAPDIVDPNERALFASAATDNYYLLRKLRKWGGGEGGSYEPPPTRGNESVGGRALVIVDRHRGRLLIIAEVNSASSANTT